MTRSKLLQDFPHRALSDLSGADIFPQVFLDGTLIGGADDLSAWLDRREPA